MAKSKSHLQCGNLTYRQRADIVKRAAQNQFQISNEDLAKWAASEFHLAKAPDRTTIGRIIRDKARYLSLAP